MPILRCVPMGGPPEQRLAVVSMPQLSGRAQLIVICYSLFVNREDFQPQLYISINFVIIKLIADSRVLSAFN